MISAIILIPQFTNEKKCSFIISNYVLSQICLYFNVCWLTVTSDIQNNEEIYCINWKLYIRWKTGLLNYTTKPGIPYQSSIRKYEVLRINKNHPWQKMDNLLYWRIDGKVCNQGTDKDTQEALQGQEMERCEVWYKINKWFWSKI